MPVPDRLAVRREISRLVVFGICLTSISLPVVWAQSDRVYAHGVVAADHPLASEAGVEVMRQGGNVVDAAVATGFALSVLRPASSGLGGGGFMVIWDVQKQSSTAIDYRERAPAKAHRETYFDPQKPGQPVPGLSYHGPRAIAIPGHVAGLCYAHQKYGKLPLREVLKPAIRLAQLGFAIDPHDREVQESVLAEMQTIPNAHQTFQILYESYLNKGVPYQTGQMVRSPQAKALQRIAEQGPSAFYEGDIARAIVQVAGEQGAWLSLKDLQSYRPTERQTLEAPIGGDRMLTMPPPSSGGIALIESLNILQAFEKRHPDHLWTRENRQHAESLHVLTEVFKHAFADRAEFLGDADYVKVPTERLISTEYADQLASRIRLEQTLSLQAYGRFQPPKDSGTTHFSVIDSAGNAVACTETVNTTFGSWIVEPEFGIVLNNEMDDFAAVPGTANAFGLIQGEANSVAAGKRPLSSMSPTIVVRDGKAVIAVGASGGPKIITATFQVLLGLSRFGLSPKEAVQAPRIHHQWLPHELQLEPQLFRQAGPELEIRGHRIRRKSESAVVQAVSRSPDGLRGASDLRKHGRAVGY